LSVVAARRRIAAQGAGHRQFADRGPRRTGNARANPQAAETPRRLPSSVLEPLWVRVAALLPTRQVHHPLGCHRPRIPDRVVVDKLIQVLGFGCGYRRIADHSCAATTLRRRRDEWIALGVAEQLRLAVLAAYRWEGRPR